MEFSIWLNENRAGWSKFALAVDEDLNFPAKTKAVGKLASYLKRRKYSKELQRQGVAAFKAWLAIEKAPRDEFSARDKERVKKALRQVWSWSYSRRLVINRCTDEEGFVYCEGTKCASKGRPVPKIHVDHIKPVGSVDRGILERLFVPSTKMQGLCGKCHGEKTRADNARTRANGVKGGCVRKATRKKKRDFTDEF